MPVDAKIEFADAQFFRVLTREGLDQVRGLVREEHFKRGRQLFVEGQAANHLWVLHCGEVRLYKSSSRGQVTTLESLGPGEMFGTTSSQQGRYTVSAEAVTPSSAWRLPARTAQALVESQPALLAEILSLTLRRLTNAQTRLSSFAYDPAPQRLALSLLEAAKNGEAQVTRRALAEASGTAVETAIRELRRFEHEGLIQGALGRIRILDEEKLRSLAELPGS